MSPGSDGSRVSLGGIQLRVGAASDAEFIYKVVTATMRSYAEQSLGAFDEDQTRLDITKFLAAGNYSVVQHEGEDIGVLAVERQVTHIYVEQVSILPSHQNCGIGTSLIRKLAREAKESRRPLRLRVLSVNPARRLYETEGFQVTSTTPERVFMELPS